jgi:hypothetical protein
MKHFFLAALFCIASWCSAQYEPDTTRANVRITDVLVRWGGLGAQAYANTLGDWHALVPASALAARDISDHRYVRSGPGVVLSFSGQVLLPLRPSARSSHGLFLAAGFSFFHHDHGSLTLEKVTRTPTDTLTSSQTGQVTYVDSVTTSRYEFNHQYDQLALDGALLYMKEYPRHWSLYAGAGVQLGVSLQGRAKLGRSVERALDPQLNGGPDRNRNGRAPFDEEEEFRTKGGIFVAGYVPLGVCYRLGLKRPFWRAVNLCYELRPTLWTGGVPELGLGAQVGIASYFGLRIDLED